MKIAIIDESIETTLPTYSTPGSAGLDLVATSKVEVPRTFSEKKNRWVGGYTLYGTNIAVEIPVGSVGILMLKSSSRDYSQQLCNHDGVIDSDYRGELMFSMKPDSTSDHYRTEYEIGDEVGQLIIVNLDKTPLKEVKYSDMSKTERGVKGHGEASAVKLSKKDQEKADKKKLEEAKQQLPADAETKPAEEAVVTPTVPAPETDATTPETETK